MKTDSLAGVLFIVFLVLKLTGVIAWSWWWVTAPLWIPAAIWGVVIVVGGLGIATGALLHRSGKRRF